MHPGPPGPGPTWVIELAGQEVEPERYSPDLDWMPRLVLLAKNTYVWLDQLSKQYQRTISRLDEIPDEELDKLARWGFTGLWLIGLWERSRASQRIKQLMRQSRGRRLGLLPVRLRDRRRPGRRGRLPDLRQRAWQRGIRLASDMVPNHMGIDSRWVIEHPDWFISLDHSPFPSYSFNGPNLSGDDRVGIYLEDHYYDAQRCRGRVQAGRPLDGQREVYLPRQRRHQHALERHGPAQLPEARGARGGHPDHPARGAQVPHHPLRRRHDPGQAPLPAALVPRAGHRRGHPLARRPRPDQGCTSTLPCPTSSGARWWTG